jgi:sn-glycerol 3-phosphate transport system ATP-binding protein
VPVAEIKSRVDKAARILQLGPFLARKPRELSGGQRQRVAMGRAIVRQPQVFLFDEPLSNLDAKLRAQTRLEIQKLHAELGVTSLFVTHDQVEAMTLAQRMLVMNAGRMEQFGTPDQVYAQPATTFVAGFIGAPPMNLLRGHASDDRFKAGDLDWKLPARAPRDGDIFLGVRPEHLDIVTGAGWPLKVEVVEMLGAERLIHGRLGSAADAAMLTVRVESTAHNATVGQTLLLQTAAQHLHWFDVASGRRLNST